MLMLIVVLPQVASTRRMEAPGAEDDEEDGGEGYDDLIDGAFRSEKQRQEDAGQAAANAAAAQAQQAPAPAPARAAAEPPAVAV
jgi:hypothetical protein